MYIKRGLVTILSTSPLSLARQEKIKRVKVNIMVNYSKLYYLVFYEIVYNIQMTIITLHILLGAIKLISLLKQVSGKKNSLIRPLFPNNPLLRTL